MLEDEDVRRITQALRAVLNAEHSVSGTIGDRWVGGEIVLRPGKSGTQEKTVPIDVFFRKLIGIRDQLRVLEQKINAHPKLDDAERLQLHEYLTRAAGSLTTFNVLFAEAEDRFVGTGSRGRGEE